MKRVWGVAAACLVLIIAGCGGVAELDSGEVQTVAAAKGAVAAAVAEGKVTPRGEQQLREMMILCRAKPLAESDGDSMREILSGMYPRLKKADPALAQTMENVATRGCD